MAGLSDMEELIGTIPDKGIASMMREAFTCYGAGAYRACIVLSHIALFEDQRRKINALAPTIKAAKQVSDHIEPLAAGQKPFETPIIHRMKAAKIISELEAQRLEAIIDHRNKAAHPSGHEVTAEEARYVFAESISKFISRPLRHTTHVVEEIILRIANKNFFPTHYTPDMQAVVAHEMESLDESAITFLVVKLLAATGAADPDAANNARNFLVALSSNRTEVARAPVVEKVVGPLSYDPSASEFVASLICADPHLLDSLPGVTLARVVALLDKNLAEHFNTPYLQLRNPANVVATCIRTLGEDKATEKLGSHLASVVDKGPYAPEFLDSCADAPKAVKRLLTRYLANARSSQWDVSNPFSSAAPSLDAPLAPLLSDQEAFELIVAIVEGADWKGHRPVELATGQFHALPNLRVKASAFAAANAAQAAEIVKKHAAVKNFPTFMATYLP